MQIALDTLVDLALLKHDYEFGARMLGARTLGASLQHADAQHQDPDEQARLWAQLEALIEQGKALGLDAVVVSAAAFLARHAPQELP